MTSLVLVDFDDTLVDTAPRFLERRHRLFDWLEGLGHPRQDVARVHHDVVDEELLPLWGFGPFRLAPSFRDTYVRLCMQQGELPSPDLARTAESFAEGIEEPSPVIPGAVEALEQLARHRRVAIWTQSHFPDFQFRSLVAARIPDIVPRDRILIVPRKTSGTFAGALDVLGEANPARTWMVGNSLRHDVNPALAQGARAIRIHCESEWHQDAAQPVHHDFLEVSSFAEAVDRLLEENPSGSSYGSPVPGIRGRT